ncbi:MAG TPA: diguanylate cyclase [Solirubrobacteraceae bacterium]|jgi:diguanylate cyclase (GGDEF)-like protein
MAAMDDNPRTTPPAPDGEPWLGVAALDERLDEEIKRAERYGIPLSCLLVVVENLDELAGEHGEELREQTLEYVAKALGGELRRFDRIGRPSDQELLVVLPGADGPRGEIVARRVLDRLRAIKVEAHGARRALRVSVGLSAWQDGGAADQLLLRARAASRVPNGEELAGADGKPQPPPVRQALAPPAARTFERR